MELDTTTPVSDDQRRLAESKKLTLQPVHADVQPDDLPNAEVATQHVNAPAIANLEGDTEQNATPIQPSPGLVSETKADKQANKFILTSVIAAASGALLVGIIFFFI